MHDNMSYLIICCSVIALTGLYIVWYSIACELYTDRIEALQQWKDTLSEQFEPFTIDWLESIGFNVDPGLPLCYRYGDIAYYPKHQPGEQWMLWSQYIPLRSCPTRKIEVEALVRNFGNWRSS